MEHHAVADGVEHARRVRLDAAALERAPDRLVLRGLRADPRNRARGMDRERLGLRRGDVGLELGAGGVGDERHGARVERRPGDDVLAAWRRGRAQHRQGRDDRREQVGMADRVDEPRRRVGERRRLRGTQEAAQLRALDRAREHRAALGVGLVDPHQRVVDRHAAICDGARRSEAGRLAAEKSEVAERGLRRRRQPGDVARRVDEQHPAEIRAVGEPALIARHARLILALDGAELARGVGEAGRLPVRDRHGERQPRHRDVLERAVTHDFLLGERGQGAQAPGRQPDPESKPRHPSTPEAAPVGSGLTQGTQGSVNGW